MFAPVPDAYRELLGAYRDVEFGDDTLVEWRDGRLVIAATDPADPTRDLRPTDDPLVFTGDGGRPAARRSSSGAARTDASIAANLAGYPVVRVDLVREPIA